MLVSLLRLNPFSKCTVLNELHANTNGRISKPRTHEVLQALESSLDSTEALSSLKWL